jgi:hypothetical protein
MCLHDHSYLYTVRNFFIISHASRFQRATLPPVGGGCHGSGRQRERPHGLWSNTQTHTCTDTYTYIHTRIHIQTPPHAHKYIETHTHTHTLTHSLKHTRKRTHTHTKTHSHDEDKPLGEGRGRERGYTGRLLGPVNKLPHFVSQFSFSLLSSLLPYFLLFSCVCCSCLFMCFRLFCAEPCRRRAPSGLSTEWIKTQMADQSKPD